MSDLAWLDSHCHFDFAVFDHDRAEQWHFAQRLGVQRLIIPGVDWQQNQKLADFCQGQPWYFALGLHPYFIERHHEEHLEALAQYLLAAPAQCIAMGEIGLDKRRMTDEEASKRQWFFFTEQVNLAEQFRLPLILHAVGMHDEMQAQLRKRRFTYGGIVHAFSGSEQQANAWRDLGFCLGIGGAMTHPRAQRLRRLVAKLPLSTWMLETDSPDMRSAFWGSERHAPAAIAPLAAILAALHQVPLASVAQQQQENFRRLFPKA